MASQFIHYEDYARKAASYRKTTEFIFGEVRRQPTMCDHIEDPKPPVIVYGASVEEAERLHNAKAAGATSLVKGGRQRKIRADQKTLASIVISHPYLLKEATQNTKMMAELYSYEQNAINWLKASYGDDLICVIRHDDEPHAHWHALVIPLSDPELKASHLHPGKAAKAKVMQDPSLRWLDSKLLNKKGDLAYQKAMRAFQDSFYEKVSRPAGLTRLGPGCRRLTRAEWHREKTQAKALKELMKEAKAYQTQEVVGLREEIALLKKEKAELELALTKSTETGTSDSEDRDTSEISTTNAKPVVGLEPSDDKPKPPPFKRPAFLTPRKPDLPDQGGQQIANGEWHKPLRATVDAIETQKQRNLPSKVEEDWYDEEQTKRKQEEHERFLENKSFTFYELCKSPEADIFLQQRARAAADARLPDRTETKQRTAPALRVSQETDTTANGKPISSIAPKLGDETRRTSARSLDRSSGMATGRKKSDAITKREPSSSISPADRRTGESEPSEPKGEQHDATNAQGLPASKNRKHNVKELPQTNAVEDNKDQSQARKFLDKVLSPWRKPRRSPDGASSVPPRAVAKEHVPDSTDNHRTPEPAVRYTRTYKVDNSKLGLPPNHDHLAGVRRRPKPAPDPIRKSDKDRPDYSPSPPSR